MAEFDPEARLIAGPQFDKIYCPSCNSPNPVGSKFCVHCSSYLDELEQTASSPGDSEDALDSLLARQKEEAPEPEGVTPLPPDPGAMPPQPISSPGASVSSAPAAPPSQAPAPEGDDPDILPEPVRLADGRVITRASTLAKLQKLQKILGEQGPLTGATKGKSEEVLALEARVAEQSKEIEKLIAEKEEIVQAYMADALNDESGEGEDFAAALEEASARASRAEAEAARLQRAEADMHKEMRDSMARIQELEAQCESLKGRLMENPDPLGGGGADPQALAQAQQRAQALQQGLAQAQQQGQALAVRVKQLEGELVAARQQASQAGEGAQQLLEGQLQEQAEALAQARQALAAKEQENLSLRNQVAAGGGGDDAQVAQLQAQLEQVQNAAKDQVRVVTRYYERILSQAPSGILVLADEGIILSVNPALSELVGTPAAELLRKPVASIPALAPLQPMLEQLGPAQETVGPEEVELPGPTGPASYRVTGATGELGARSVKILALQLEGASGGSGGGADTDAMAIREDLFGLRMMIELLASKADKPEVVGEVARDLLGDLDRIVANLS